MLSEKQKEFIKKFPRLADLMVHLAMAGKTPPTSEYKEIIEYHHSFVEIPNKRKEP